MSDLLFILTLVLRMERYHFPLRLLLADSVMEYTKNNFVMVRCTHDLCVLNSGWCAKMIECFIIILCHCCVVFMSEGKKQTSCHTYCISNWTIWSHLLVKYSGRMIHTTPGCVHTFLDKIQNCKYVIKTRGQKFPSFVVYDYVLSATLFSRKNPSQQLDDYNRRLNLALLSKWKHLLYT